MKTNKASLFLAAIDADWEALVVQVGPSGLEIRQADPYEALIRAIAHQQLHGKAAAAILARLHACFPGQSFPSPAQLLAMEDEQLKACGFSTSKRLAVKDVAQKRLEGIVPDREQATAMDDATLIEQLTRIRGVGRWTVEMLLIFNLGRPDILPVDDFGVREGWRRLKRLPEQPRPKALAAIGESWQPYRSTAAWYLWRAAERLPA